MATSSPMLPSAYTGDKFAEATNTEVTAICFAFIKRDLISLFKSKMAKKATYNAVYI